MKRDCIWIVNLSSVLTVVFLFSVCVFNTVSAAVIYSQTDKGTAASNTIGASDSIAQYLGTGLSGTVRSVTLNVADIGSSVSGYSMSIACYGNSTDAHNLSKGSTCSAPTSVQTGPIIPANGTAMDVTIPLNSDFTFNSSKYYRLDISQNIGSNRTLQFYGSVTNTDLNGACLSSIYSGTYPNLTYHDCITDYNLYDLYYLFRSEPIQMVMGNIQTNTTWQSGTVYIVSGNVTVNSGVTLTIKPGTVIKFDTATSSALIVSGTVNATSTATSAVFTSLKDDLLGGDTNMDGASTTPSAGDWTGITVNSGGVLNLGRVIVRYGGSASGSNAMIYNNGGTLTIATSTIAYGSNYGIKNSAGTTTVQTTDIAFNTYGLYFSGGSASITATSTIHDNSSYGVYNSTASIINMEGNYWGDSSGPYHSTNTSGLGNAVSDYIDFSPWIGTSTLHYVMDCPTLGYCGSIPVNSSLLLLANSTTTFASQLGASTSTWNTLGLINIVAPTSTAAELAVYDVTYSDVSWKGGWIPIDSQPDQVFLNAYYLNHNTSSEVQNTITHELGHALGLGHSYLGNIMNFFQTALTTLGSQDISDYYYLW